MSVHMKKHLTNIEIDGKQYTMPEKRKKIILSLVKEFSSDDVSGDNIDSEDVFKDLYQDRPKGAVHLRGARAKENMSQKELEKLTGISATNISKYENGSRAITGPIAKKFAKALKINFKSLL